MTRLSLVGLALVCCVIGSAVFSLQVSALGLKVQPLIYSDTLNQGETKKGYVDVSNPTNEKVQLKTSVQAFRQIDDQGNLEFYDSEQIEAGLKVDLDEFELGPKQALRLYFVLDGTKLPSGDVFAALFVSSKPKKLDEGSATAVRVGTLFTIVNGTPGAREAAVTGLDVPFWQFGDQITGSYQINNTADADKASGYYPEVNISLWPFGGKTTDKSSLVFAGNTRSNDFAVDGPAFGIYKLTADYQYSSQDRWIFVAKGWLPWAVIGLILAGLAALWFWRSRQAKSRLGGGLRINKR